MYDVILTLDLATKTGWALLRKDGTRTSGVENFKVTTRESRGMLFVKFSSWLKKKVLQEGVELVIYEMPHHRGGAATSLLVGLATKVKEVHSNLLDLAKEKDAYLETISPFDKEVLCEAAGIVEGHGFEILGWTARTFEYTSVSGNTVKSFVKDELDWRERGLTKAQRESMTAAEITAFHKRPTIKFFQKQRRRKPVTDDEADAWALLRWAEQEYRI